jgi:3-hydroxyacyl-[acyl-carrier-protein] dehydratase
MDIHEIIEHLPHRYPFLLVDRVLECRARKIHPRLQERDHQRTVFYGPLPASPGDARRADHGSAGAGGGILSFKTLGEKPDMTSLFYFVGIDKARFKKTVTAGDQLHLHVEHPAPVAQHLEIQGRGTRRRRDRRRSRADVRQEQWSRRRG